MVSPFLSTQSGAKPRRSRASKLPAGAARFFILGLSLAGLFLLSLAAGSVSIPLLDVVTILLGGQGARATWASIILNFRLPETLTAILAGAGLGISGLLMQTLFRNPLADPYVLGVSSGASLGVALVVLASGAIGTSLLAGMGPVGDLGVAAAASLGAALLMLVILWTARRVSSSLTLLILGLLFGYLTSALVSLLLHFSIPERIQAYITWTFGSFGGVTWSQLRVLAPATLAGLASAFWLSKPLNALLLGEFYAQSMGVDVRRTRLAIIATTALLAGTITAFCGPIAFIGIAIPHVCRGLFSTADHRVLAPATILVGAIVALTAAFIARVPGSNVVLPLNAVTALIGAPAVIWVILRARNIQKGFEA